MTRTIFFLAVALFGLSLMAIGEERCGPQALPWLKELECSK